MNIMAEFLIPDDKWKTIQGSGTRAAAQPAVEIKPTYVVLHGTRVTPRGESERPLNTSTYRLRIFTGVDDSNPI
ncbi:hypothetical protein ACFL2C_03625 [Patescibacteria group bacterium]